MRLANRVLATLIAGAIAAFSALVAVEIVLGYYFDRDPWLLSWDRWNERSRALTSSDRAVVVTFVLIGVAGIVLLAIQLWRRPPMALPLENITPDVHAEINRRSLEQALGRAALRVDGITGVHVRSRRQRINVRAETPRRQPGDLRDHVTAAAGSALTDLRLRSAPRLIVDVQSHRPAGRQP